MRHSVTFGSLALAACIASACGSSDGTSFVDGGGSSAGSSPLGASGAGNGAAGTLNLTAMADGGAAGDGTVTCGGTKLAAAPTAVNVLLLVDKSSSMTSTPTGFGSTKWAAMQTALSAAIEATQGSVAFGLDFFPSSDTPSSPLPSACSLPTTGEPLVAIGASGATTSAIEKALTSNTPAGATPTAGALTRALDYFTKGAGAKLSGARYVLLATDGGPNCDSGLTCAGTACTVNMDGICPANTNCCDPKLDPDGPSKCLDDSASVAAVKALDKANVETFVVGIPGTEVYKTTLDDLASAGGVDNPNAPPNYFSVSATGGAKALTQVLTQITTGLIRSCLLQLSSDAPDPNQINVYVDHVTIPEGSADGWTLDTSTSPATVVLQGKTCEQVKSVGAEHVDVTFGCPTAHVK